MSSESSNYSNKPNTPCGLVLDLDNAATWKEEHPNIHKNSGTIKHLLGHTVALMNQLTPSGIPFYTQLTHAALFKLLEVEDRCEGTLLLHISRYYRGVLDATSPPDTDLTIDCIYSADAKVDETAITFAFATALESIDPFSEEHRRLAAGPSVFNAPPERVQNDYHPPGDHGNIADAAPPPDVAAHPAASPPLPIVRYV